MTIKEFVDAYQSKRFMNTKTGTDERSEYIRNELAIKTYIPFREKRQIAEMIVAQNISEVDGIKKYDDIGSYVSLVVASIAAHTTLEFSADPIADYDLLAESGLLTQIIAEFQGSHEEIGILLKMAIAAELEDNNTNVIIGHFLDSILKKLDGVSDAMKEKIEKLDIKKEDLAKLKGFLNRLK
ncbi:MAG: hypothetical protein UH850_11285 [Paludibacteraceae bacterium]|nr:hypothetical protein [Paludibacteraceae bacterium]